MSFLRNLLRFSALGMFCLAACSADQITFADGSTANWAHWKGRWVLINYWAEWCAPCRREIPELNSLHRDRARSGAVVFGVNYDGIAGDELHALAQKMGITFPVLAEDPRGRFVYERPTVLPTTVIVGPDGEVFRIMVGVQTVETLQDAFGET